MVVLDFGLKVCLFFSSWTLVISCITFAQPSLKPLAVLLKKFVSWCDQHIST